MDLHTDDSNKRKSNKKKKSLKDYFFVGMGPYLDIFYKDGHYSTKIDDYGSDDAGDAGDGSDGSDGMDSREASSE